MTYRERLEEREGAIAAVRAKYGDERADEMSARRLPRMNGSDCYCGCDASTDVNEMQDEIDELRGQLRALSESFVHLQECVATAGMFSTRTIAMNLPPAVKLSDTRASV